MSKITPTTGESVEATHRKSFTPKQRLETLLAFKGRCAKCGEKIGDDPFEINHRVPLFQGGKHEPDNWEPIHRSCHRELTDGKHAKENAKIRRLRIKQLPKEQQPKAQPIRGRGFRSRWAP